MHPYLLSLCTEYVELVDAMQHGQYTRDELRTIDSQRQVAHNQLLDCLGSSRDDIPDMYNYARRVLMIAKGNNIQ